MNANDPIFPLNTIDWDAAAQEAAFEGRSFCMRADGRFINRAHLPDDIPHRNPFLESDSGDLGGR
jgi:hypothetical protein